MDEVELILKRLSSTLPHLHTTHDLLSMEVSITSSKDIDGQREVEIVTLPRLQLLLINTSKLQLSSS